jgi:hypothetical protein
MQRRVCHYKVSAVPPRGSINANDLAIPKLAHDDEDDNEMEDEDDLEVRRPRKSASTPARLRGPSKEKRKPNLR